MTRWMYPTARPLPPASDRFDPVLEGARYRLPPDLLRALWDRACTDATDGTGRRDDAGARQRFHQLAVLAVARGGRPHPDVGAMTQVEPTSGDELPEGWVHSARRADTPGRETLVMAEARRWARRLGAPAPDASRAAAAPATATAGEPSFLPAGALPPRESTVPEPARIAAGALPPHEPTAAESAFIAAGALPRREPPVTPIADRVDALFGRRPAPGAFDPRSAAGRALVAHELTHVVHAQQGRVAAAPAGQVRVSEPGDVLEQEADRIARCFGTAWRLRR